MNFNSNAKNNNPLKIYFDNSQKNEKNFYGVKKFLARYCCYFFIIIIVK